MKVCIAEKPSVAKEIAYQIGARSRKDGYYEGNGYCVTWTFGHLCTLKEPDDYQSEWKKWQLASLPMLPDNFGIKLISNKNSKKQFRNIKNLLKRAEVVINCGDAGQEGELIQRWVLQQANYRGRVLRLWISSLTPEAIRDGFRKLIDAREFDPLYQAGRSRAIGDWLLGMNATRLYTLKYGAYKQVLSIGRVQTPTLAMLVARHKEIESFVPQTYWELETIYREVTFSCERGRFIKKEEGTALLAHVQGKPFKIISFKKKKGKEYPPSLFDLTSLQVHCNKRFAFSAEQTLNIVQKLYEKKLVTYPRVDTTYLPNDQYPNIPGILSQLSNYQQFTQPLLGKPIRKSAKVFNDKKITDHHAIIPTGQEKSLPDAEQKVYDAIVRRFIAAFYPDCIVSHTTVIGEVDTVTFKATGKEILEPGWRVLFPRPAKSAPTRGKQGDKKEENIMPTFTEGEQGEHEPSLQEKQTQPPKTYTEATLLRAMETAGRKVDDEGLRELMKANGIGRPSTRANIIETLFRRRYVQRKKKQLIPTELGIQLIDLIHNDLLKSAELTGQWEKQLREIEDGQHSSEQFVADMKQMVQALVSEVKQDERSPRIAAPPARKKYSKRTQRSATTKPPRKSAGTSKADVADLTCPKCKQATLLKGKQAYGCGRWREGCDFRLPFTFLGKKLPERQLIRLVQKGATIQLKGFQVDGNKAAGKLSFDKNFQLELDGEKNSDRKQRRTSPPVTTVPKQLPCPICRSGHVLRGKQAYGCSRWQEGCDFRFPFEDVRQRAAGRPIDRKLLWQLLQEFGAG